jgi:hypothetical protein
MTGTEVKETPRDVLVVCFSAPGRKTGLVSFLFSRSVGDQLAKVLDGLRQDKERLGRWMFDDVCSNLQYPSVIISYHFILCIHPFHTFSNEIPQCHFPGWLPHNVFEAGQGTWLWRPLQPQRIVLFQMFRCEFIGEIWRLCGGIWLVSPARQNFLLDS